MVRKLKVVRVVTASYVVPWHMGSTLKRMAKDFEVCVVGQGVSIHQNTYPDIKWVDIDINRKINLISDLLSLFNLCRFLYEYKPDIVHSVMHKAALLTAIAGFICRIPVRINTFTGQYWATKKGLARRIYYLSDKVTNYLNTVCLTDSPSQSEFLHKHKISNAGKPLPVLLKGSLAGVDVERFNLKVVSSQAKNLRNELGVRQDEFVYIFLARKTRDKGAIDLLNAFYRVRKANIRARLLFVGPDESEGEIDLLRETIPDIFTSVININRGVDNHEIYLAASDVLCLPSYKEGFGSIVIDAAALGVPAIGSNIPGLVDSIEDGQTGVLFSPGDIDGLAGLMLNFMVKPEKYSLMRIAARKRVEKYFTADLLYVALKTFYVNQVGMDSK
jgi:glycosyltransferase involved in cell wall biosynthesis